MINDIAPKTSTGPASKTFFKSLYTNKTRLAVLIVVVLIAGYFIYGKIFTTTTPARYVLAQASKQTIITTVSGTGQVSQDRSVNITPSSAGKITAVTAKQGQQIKSGQTIAIIDETNNTLALNQAKAGLASAQASYDQTIAGSTSQDVQLSQLSVDSAQQALDNAKANLETVKKQQALNVASAFFNYMNAGLQAVPATNNAGTGVVTISGGYSSTTPGIYTIGTYNGGAGLFYNISGIEISTGSINKSVLIPLGTYGLSMQFTGNITPGDSWTVSIPNTSSASYITSYTSYQTALANQSSAITSAQNQITSAQNSLTQAQINLQVKKQPPTDQQLSSAKAQLLNAQVSLQNAEINYNNNILKAPFDGEVAQVNSQIGDQATGSTIVAVVTTNQSIAIIPLNEVDVAKVKQGNKATMTFDAIDGLSITGKVVQIDNIGTVSQGVVNYNVKVAFDTEDPRVKQGMSVNVAIITAVKADVIAVPNTAVKSTSGRSYVQTLDPSKTVSDPTQTGVTSSQAPTQTTVQTGLADDTYTEIVSGINEGDSVVTQTISTATKTTTTGTSATNLLRGTSGGGFRGPGG